MVAVLVFTRLGEIRFQFELSPLKQDRVPAPENLIKRNSRSELFENCFAAFEFDFKRLCSVIISVNFVNF